MHIPFTSKASLTAQRHGQENIEHLPLLLNPSPKKITLSEISSYLSKQVSKQDRNKILLASPNFFRVEFWTIVSLVFFWKQQRDRSKIPNDQLRITLKAKGIKANRGQLKWIGEIYEELSKLVTKKQCRGVPPDIRRNWHIVNFDTALSVEGKTFNANRIADIQFPSGEKISLIASMMISREKSSHMRAFAKLLLQPNKVVVVVNLTQAHEGKSYMPDEDERIEFGGMTKSHRSINENIEPYAFVRKGKVRRTKTGNTFCEIEIQNADKQTLSNKPIIFVSWPAADHEPASYEDLREFVRQMKALAKKYGISLEELICWIHCKGGMGRSSQYMIALMMEAEIEKNETPAELLIRMVIKYCDARRYLAVNKPGFFASYNYAVRRKQEKCPNYQTDDKDTDLQEIFRRIQLFAQDDGWDDAYPTYLDPTEDEQSRLSICSEITSSSFAFSDISKESDTNEFDTNAIADREIFPRSRAASIDSTEDEQSTSLTDSEVASLLSASAMALKRRRVTTAEGKMSGTANSQSTALDARANPNALRSQRRKDH